MFVALTGREWSKIDLDLKDKTAKYSQPVWKYCGPITSLENSFSAQKTCIWCEASAAHLRPFMEENVLNRNMF